MKRFLICYYHFVDVVEKISGEYYTINFSVLKVPSYILKRKIWFKDFTLINMNFRVHHRWQQCHSVRICQHSAIAQILIGCMRFLMVFTQTNKKTIIVIFCQNRNKECDILGSYRWNLHWQHNPMVLKRTHIRCNSCCWWYKHPTFLGFGAKSCIKHQGCATYIHNYDKYIDLWEICENGTKSTYSGIPKIT